MNIASQIAKVTHSQVFKELIKYAIVGIVGLIIDLGIFYLLTQVYHVQFLSADFIHQYISPTTDSVALNSTIAHVISSFIAIVNNFLLNSYLTFSVKDKKWKRFASFFGIALVGLVVSTLLYSLFISIAGVNYAMYCKFLAVMIVAMLQFVFNKFITFKR